MGLRGANQAVTSNLPFLEPADADPVSRPSWSIFAPVRIQWYPTSSPRCGKSFIITKRSVNAVMNDCVTWATAFRPTAGGSFVDTYRPVRLEERGYTFRILATPRGGIARRKIGELSQSKQHSYLSYQGKVAYCR